MGKMTFGKKQPMSEEIKKVETPKPIIVYVDRPIEKIVEIEKEVIKFVDREIIKPVNVEVIKEVEKEVVKFVDREVIKEVIKEIEKPMEVIRIQFQKVFHLPNWAIQTMIIEAVVIAALLLK